LWDLLESELGSLFFLLWVSLLVFVSGFVEQCNKKDWNFVVNGGFEETNVRVLGLGEETHDWIKVVVGFLRLYGFKEGNSIDDNDDESIGRMRYVEMLNVVYNFGPIE
jgi:hypothetical protein